MGGASAALDAYSDDLMGAWSVARKLLTTYTGPLIRVYRESNAAETDVNADASGNLDTAALMAWAEADVVRIKVIYDQGPLGLDLTAADITKAYRIATGSTLDEMSGRPAGYVTANDTCGYVSDQRASLHAGGVSAYWAGQGGDGAASSQNGWSYAKTGVNVRLSVDALNGARVPYVGVVAAATTNNTQASPVSGMLNNYNPGETLVATTRDDGTDVVFDTAWTPGTTPRAAALSADYVMLNAIAHTSNLHYASIGQRFGELVVWDADIGEAALLACQRNAEGYFAEQTAWAGKRILWVGTSIPGSETDTGNARPYPLRIGQLLGAKVINEAQGSSKLTYGVASFQNLTGTIAEYIANGFTVWQYSSWEWRCAERIGAPNYIVIDHCVNDYLDTTGAITSTDKTEYCGALNYFRDEMMAIFPNVQFIALTPPTRYTFSGSAVAGIEAKAAALIAWAAQYSNVTLLDMMAGLGWVLGDNATYLGDGTHLNSVGTAAVANWLETAMLAITPTGTPELHIT